MAVQEITSLRSQPRVYLLTLFLGLSFFAATFFLRYTLLDFSSPFVYLFVGLVLLSFISGRMENLILLILITTSSVFGLQELPTVPIKIGDLSLPDILILALLLGWVLKRVTQEVTVIPGPMAYPIIAFILTGLFSFLYATVGFKASTNGAGIELRTILYLTQFFLVIYYIRSDRQLRTVMLGLAIIACLVAGLLILQYILGSSAHLVFGKVSILNTTEGRFSDITRVLIPGSSLMLFALNTFLAIYLMRGLPRRRWFLYLGIALLMMAILLTFTRVFWIMILAAVALLLFVVRRRTIVYPRLMLLLSILFLAAAIFLQAKILNPTDIKEALINRSLSIVRAPMNFQHDTLYMRYLESRYAWERILENPVLGIGLGRAYRPQIFGRSNYENSIGGTNVHNGYLAIQLKLGLAGTLAFFWLIGAFFLRLRKRWRKLQNPLYQAFALGVAISLCGLLIHNLVASPFLSINWTAIVGVGLGLVEKIYQFEGLA